MRAVSDIRRPLAAAARVALCLTAFASGAGRASAADGATEDPNNWPQYHRTADGWRYSPLDAVNTGTVSGLKVAWIHQPGDIAQGLQSTPLTIDGVIYYIAANNRVFALDAVTGKEIWRYITQLHPKTAEIFFNGYNRGVTVGRGKLYFGTLDGRAIALDQRTGKEAWQTQLTDFETCQGCNFTSPPVLAGDVLTLGPTGGELAQSGHVYGLDADTGRRVWTFDVLKDDPKSWTASAREHGGGGAWMPGQYDEETGNVYYGTSNAAPDFDGPSRPGDNLYTASIVAIKAKTGDVAWHHQEVPHDMWDYDSTYEFLMLKRDGKDVIVHLNKDGFVSVLDRRTGDLIRMWPFAQHINWAKLNAAGTDVTDRNEPQAGKEGVFCPSVLGARSWNHGAYNPKTGLWYNNAVEICTKVTMGTQDPKTLALPQPFFGATAIDVAAPPGEKASARLDARDPVTGKLAWSISYPSPALGSVLTTAGGLVFNGDSTGVVHAYDAKDGKDLWSFNTGSGIRAGITSYAVDGKQYILVPSGFGSLFAGFAAGLFPDYKKSNGGAALIAFTLN